MSKLTMERVCRCKGTSSGPRVVEINSTASGEPMGHTYSFQYVAMACDICDTPWLTKLAAP